MQSPDRSPTTPPADAAVLAVPALVLAMFMLGGALCTAVRVPQWAADYGGLVYVAAALYLAGALGLIRWGLTLRRGR